MSKQGWKDFLHAEGVDDWVVLHGGPTAAFETGSLAAAAELAAAITRHVAGLEGTPAALTITSGRVTVRLNREVWGTERRHIELARAVSAVARAHGAPADRAAVQEVQVAISAKPDSIDLPFWRAVLGYAPMHEDNAIDPLAHGSNVWMQELPAEKALRHAMHIDVSMAREEAERRLQAALEAGGRIVDDTDAPEGWVLSDRAGNKVCIATWPDGAVARGVVDADAGAG
jgi:4a-hydroxytetrahydrobiopterin dehydratase